LSPKPIDSSVWGTDSGLLDDFSIVFSDVWFGPNPESDFPDVIYMHVRGQAVVDGDVVADDHAIRFGTGKNWEVVSGGEAVEHAAGNLKFHGRSACGMFVNRVLALMNEDSALMDSISSRGAPTEVATWQGLAFDMELIEDSFTDKAGEKHEFFRVLPTAYRADLVGGSKAKAESNSDGGLTKKELKRAVIKFAKTFDADDFEDFKTDVVDSDEFEYADDIGEALMALILDEDELFAEAH